MNATRPDLLELVHDLYVVVSSVILDDNILYYPESLRYEEGALSQLPTRQANVYIGMRLSQQINQALKNFNLGDQHE